MPRERTGSKRWRNGRVIASLPDGHGGRREASFATEAQADRWIADGLAALDAGQPLPDPDHYRTPSPRTRRAARADTPTFAEACWAWHNETYETLRQASPSRSRRVADNIRLHLIPWFAPRTTTIADVARDGGDGVVDWLLHLAGRTPSASPACRSASASRADSRLVDFDEAAALCGVSLSTMKRRRRDGRLPHARHDPARGRILVPVSDLRAAGLLDAEPTRPGLSRGYAGEQLWTLRKVLGYARAKGWMAHDPTEGLRALVPDAEVAHTKPTTTKQRPLTLAECRDAATRLHVVFQLVLWLQRILGLRISEAYGPHVGDVVDLGDQGLLVIARQGGRPFLVRDTAGTIVTVHEKDETKTASSYRMLVVPAALMHLIRLVVRAFHTDPHTGEVDLDARLVPGLHAPNRGGQAAYRSALHTAVADAGLADLGFAVVPHLLRKSLATDLAWTSDLDDLVRRRVMGHVAGGDVYARHYTLDTPKFEPLRKVADQLDRQIVEEIGDLVVPTVVRPAFGRDHPYRERRDHIDLVLAQAGWQLDHLEDDPLLDATQAAELIGHRVTTVRKWMRTGKLPTEQVAIHGGTPRRRVRRSVVRALLASADERRNLRQVADELRLDYHEAWRMLRRLGIDPPKNPWTGEFVLDDADITKLEHERDRVTALHRRSVKAGDARRALRVSLSTVYAMIRRGELVIDDDTDSSGALFITRESIQAARVPEQPAATPNGAVLNLDVVKQITGLATDAIMSLARAGHLEAVTIDRRRHITHASLLAWATGYRPDLLRYLDTIANTDQQPPP